MADRLENKVALVTGAGRGVGRAIAEAFAQEGAKLMLLALEADEVQRVASSLRAAGADVVALDGDLAEEATVFRMVDSSIRHFGRVDVLVNNAGVIFRDDTLETPVKTLLDHWDKAIGINCRAMYLACVLAAKEMAKRGSGTVINISSTQAKVALPRMTAYAASKYGVVGLTQSLGRELDTTGIKFYAVCPGGIRTELAREVLGEEAYDRAKSSLMPPEDIAEVVRKLAIGEIVLQNGESIVVERSTLLS